LYYLGLIIEENLKIKLSEENLLENKLLNEENIESLNKEKDNLIEKIEKILKEKDIEFNKINKKNEEDISKLRDDLYEKITSVKIIIK
jgi:hypothetical protein